MPTIGSETYRSSIPPDSPTKETRLSESHEGTETIKGDDWTSLAPVIQSLDPATAISPGPDFTITVTGNGFELFSIINWNGGDEPTEYVSPTELRTTVKPSTVEAPLPFTLSVYVRNGELKSPAVPFTFEEAPAIKKGKEKEEVELEHKKHEPKPNPEDEKNAPKHPYPHAKVQPKHRR